MSLPAAYIGVILIWSTTPLAIQWSGDGGGFLFGVTARMILGAFASAVILMLLRISLQLHRAAILTYLAAGLGIFSAMLSVYWASQFIPSGWISVIFGLSPIITGIFASLFLEESLTPVQLLGMLTGIAGLAVIFYSGDAYGPEIIYGIGGVLLSVTLHAASAVAIKRIGIPVHPLATTTGGLLIAAPLFSIVYLLSDTPAPVSLPAHAIASILYLGIGASVLGFALYYYVLHHFTATRVALITLITPVLALAIGNTLNNEVVNGRVIGGTAIILIGLLVYQYGPRLPSPENTGEMPPR